MKTAILCYLLSLSPVEQSAIREALGQIETGGNDKAVGPQKERSRYQILPSVWRENSMYRITSSEREPVAWEVASRIINKRAGYFHRVMGRWPNHAETYALWSRPVRFYGVQSGRYSLSLLTHNQRDRCIRFQNLVEATIQESKGKK